MLKKRQDIVKAAVKQESGVEKARDRVVRQIQQMLSAYSAEVRVMILDPKRFKSGDVTFQKASKLIAELAEVLNDTGLDAVVNGYLDEYEQLNEQVKDYFDGAGLSTELSGVSEKSLQTYIGYSEDLLVDTVQRRMVQPLQEAIFQGVFAGRTTEQLMDDIGARLDTVDAVQFESLVEENMRRYQRALTAETAEEVGLLIYEYVGPDDEITSDQCRAILHGGDHGVPAMYLKEEITIDMVDGLKDNPMVAGGHYGCRHKFMPVTEAYARSQGWEE